MGADNSDELGHEFIRVIRAARSLTRLLSGLCLALLPPQRELFHRRLEDKTHAQTSFIQDRCFKPVSSPVTVA